MALREASLNSSACEADSALVGFRVQAEGTGRCWTAPYWGLQEASGERQHLVSL